MKYRILQSGGYPNNGSTYELEERVQKYIDDGWKPQGGLTSFQESTGGGMHTRYSQAMIKPEPSRIKQAMKKLMRKK